MFSKFGVGTRRERQPLSPQTKAIFSEKLKQLEECIRRGEAYKQNSTKRFGGTNQI